MCFGGQTMSNDAHVWKARSYGGELNKHTLGGLTFEPKQKLVWDSYL